MNMAEIRTTFFWFVLVSITLLGRAQGFSSYTFKDYSLKIQSYVKMLTVDWLECILACSHDSLCLSYTYQYHKPVSGICELYECGMDHCLTPGKTLVFTRGYVFQQIKPIKNQSRCIKDIDECASTPCQNGGNCTGKENGFMCECPNGYTGNRCEDKHEGTCTPNPCQNGGTCNSSNGVFWCSCNPNHYGYTCQSVKVE
ncbi:fibropellin-3-like [Actinia tenebrosa]|uniref:Fibropellin-3-like n=1 Tax=Actinia tenebrosa TaxID=6105 RepID=A0A6P8HAI0_ACTTE|nr:fibropellin-3-like [Actinia tenebrosa]